MSTEQEQKNSNATENLVQTKKPNTSLASNAETVSESGSFMNSVFWCLGLAGLVSATLVNQYLPAYWQPASNIWIRIGVIVTCVILGVVFLLLTQQGKGFSKLLKDTQIELRRVSWPNKDETIEYTWKVLLVIFISGVLIYILDGVSSMLVGPFIQ